MKKTIYLTLVFTLIFGTGIFAQKKETTFKVYGNCGMCEKRIEKAANALDGVTDADWDKTSKRLSVSVDTTQTKALAVHEAIADAGHDTKLVKATDEAYNDLPECCQYAHERKNVEKEAFHPDRKKK